MYYGKDFDAVGAPDAVDQGVGEYLKTTTPQAVAEYAIELRRCRHPLFCFFPLPEKPKFKAVRLRLIPPGGIQAFLESLLDVNDFHRSEIGSEVLVDPAPDILRRNRLCPTFVYCSSSALQFFSPFR
jgi:hypothetical protein